MPLGQSIIAGFIASEVAGYVAEQFNASPKTIRLTKCFTATGVGTVTAAVTADLWGVVGVLVLGTAYLGGHDPLYLVVEAIGSALGARSKGQDSAS